MSALTEVETCDKHIYRKREFIDDKRHMNNLSIYGMSQIVTLLLNEVNLSTLYAHWNTSVGLFNQNYVQAKRK